MKRLLILLVLAILLPALSFAETGEARLMHFPDIHDDLVVFAYAGDLWTVSGQGGTARRLTSHPGMERYPKFSPCGKWIAFTGEYDGNSDIFVIPAQGGEPRRVTWHPGADQILDWYPDGKSLLFRSRRYSFWNRFNRLFKIPVAGGFARPLPLPTGELSSLNDDATRIAYNRMGREFRTWKRYRGGMAPNIWIYDFAANRIQAITKRDANDMFPMWQGQNIYYVSDRTPDKVMNLFVYNTEKKDHRQLTQYADYDVQWPGIGPGALVYEQGGHLHIMDMKTEKSRLLHVRVPGENLFTRPHIAKVADYVHAADISPSGVRALFSARGDIFTVPAEKGDPRNLTRTPGIRENHPAWSPDGRWVAYVSDRTGEYEIYLRPADGSGEERRITSGSSIWYQGLLWSPDSRKLLYSDAAVNLWYADVKSGATVKVDHGQFEGTSNFIHGSWSPDSRWITYHKGSRNGLDSIYIYSLEENLTRKVTSDMTDDAHPVFGPDGKYLFFVANREHNYSFSAVEFMHYHFNPGKIVLVTLQAATPNPLAPESDEETVKTESTKVPDKKGKSKKSEKTQPATPRVTIEFDNLAGRIIDLPVPDGNYAGIRAFKGRVLFYSHPVAGSGQRGMTLHVFDMQKRKLESIAGGLRHGLISADGKKALVLEGRHNWSIIDTKPGAKTAKGRINLAAMTMRVDPRAEWKQVYKDAWRLARDFFYDPNMHGRDWKAIGEKYGKLLPFVAHRHDLNYLIGEVIGELNSSHTYRGGGDYPEVDHVHVGLLGCDLEADEKAGRYRIAKIYRGQNWDPGRRGPLAQPGMNVQAGDYLLSVNGRELRYPENPYAAFENTVGKAVTLHIHHLPALEGSRKIVVVPVADELLLRYRDWVNTNRHKVAEATQGRVGYIHLPATAAPGVEAFTRDFYPQIRKDGLIIDVRYNNGGHIPDIFMSRLDRKLLGLWATRYTAGFASPHAAHYGPKVCITNGYAGSGGDAFPFFFRLSGLGKLIGTRTWGGLIGISGTPPLMDNGAVAIADFSFYNPDGEWDVENKGVSPDIEVDDRPDLMINGRDPSLERAIAEIMASLKKLNSPILPPRPAKNPVR